VQSLLCVVNMQLITTTVATRLLHCTSRHTRAPAATKVYAVTDDSVTARYHYNNINNNKRRNAYTRHGSHSYDDDDVTDGDTAMNNSNRQHWTGTRQRTDHSAQR
jgi:hypothetical protein